MAEFSGKIISAEYMNAEYSLIKVRYNDDGINAIYHLEADPDHADFQALEADGWDAERIIDATAESKRVQSNAWNLEVNAAAQVLFSEMKEQVEQVKQQSQAVAADAVAQETASLIDTNSSEVYNYVIFDKDKDTLFKFKLWALESDIFKAATKTQKSSLRKSKSILEGLAVINAIINK